MNKIKILFISTIIVLSTHLTALADDSSLPNSKKARDPFTLPTYMTDQITDEYKHEEIRFIPRDPFDAKSPIDSIKNKKESKISNTEKYFKTLKDKYNLNLIPTRNSSVLSLFNKDDEDMTQKIIESSSGDTYVFDKEDSKIMTKEEIKEEEEEIIGEEDVDETETKTTIKNIKIDELHSCSAADIEEMENQNRPSIEAGTKARITADQVDYIQGKATATGNAIIFFRGTMIKADQLIYDEANKKLYANGHVDISQNNSRLKAESGTYDMETGISEIFNGYGYTDEVEKGDQKINGKIYFWGEHIVREEEKTTLTNAIITTCDEPEPNYHYHIRCKEAEIYPGKKLIAHHSKLKIKNRTLLNYKRLVLALNKKNQSLIPTIGHNATDGWYIKKDFDFDLFNSPAIGTLELYEKSGIGYGLKYPYQLNNGKIIGLLEYYNLSPNKTALIKEDLTNEEKNREVGKKEFRNNIRYEIGNGYYTGMYIGSYDYQYPNERSRNWNNYNLYFGRSTEKEKYKLTQTVTDYNKYSYQTRSFDYGRDLGNGWTARVGFYNNGRSDSESIWRYYTDVNYSNNFVDATLSYLTTTNDKIYHLDKTPELNFISKNMYLGTIPIKAGFSLGSYKEEPTSLHMTKSKFYIGVSPTDFDLGKYGDLQVAGGFYQILCEDGSQKYSFSGMSNYTYSLNDHINLKAGYFFQSPKGYSPFVEDYIQSYSLITAGAEIYNGEKWKFMISGGYDYMYDSKTSIISTLYLHPNDKLDLKLGTHYNIDQHTFPSITSEIKWDIGNGLSLENWTLYDTVNSKLTYFNVGLSKETHDFVTKILYRHQQKDLWFEFYLKAFPENPTYITPNPTEIISPRR